MTETIAERPFWRLAFDADGDPDRELVAALDAEITGAGITDLVMFSHGWNNGQEGALDLYRRWFTLLDDHIAPARRVGLAGVLWPSQLWRDESMPDFAAPPAPAESEGGAAGLDAARSVPAGSCALDPRTVAELDALFPSGADQLAALAGLLDPAAPAVSATQLVAHLRGWHEAVASGTDDGELVQAGVPGMFDDDHDPTELLEAFAEGLSETGVDVDSGDGIGGGAAGFGEFATRIRHGAKEALRQLSYWKMKGRAGVVGRAGVGPVITGLAANHPELRIHLIGHSFGGRVVAFALDGLDTDGGSPIKSITILQGAFSRFAFTERLPFASGGGALAGRLRRLDGPLTVCYSSFDSALGTMYPLASLAAGDASSDASDELFRFRAMGSHGAFEPLHKQPLGGVGATYPFEKQQILNLDASTVVNQGPPPGGAHSDIFKPQLAWVVAAASGLHRAP
ncbi:serine-threonine protein kinase [Nocardia bovistercoris]|uniref:Serine-threonine protein kinase n=1 Tax=Nocardia bovistercoris TaxID=2785916 RepID=A0A931IHR9_9NOCA|nr:serine-threonine protein kinase [Nocardia bovistercoris]MBH0780257.1 serine-threonine protein kinase [Nocardia bovistercoris]